MADIEIDRRIEFGIGEFVDHIGSDNSQLCRSMRDKGCNIKGTHADKADIRPVCCEAERAARFIRKCGFRLDPGCNKKGQGFVEQASFRDSKDDRLSHDGAGFTCALQ